MTQISADFFQRETLSAEICVICGKIDQNVSAAGGITQEDFKLVDELRQKPMKMMHTSFTLWRKPSGLVKP